MSGKEIAQTTLYALGGTSRLNIMIGAKNFTCDNETGCLTFHFKMCRKANIVSFEVTSLDEYKITFYQSKKFDVVKVKEIDGVYIEQLKEIFEDFTGLYLTL